MKVDGYDISMEEAAEIISDLMPINAVTKQQQAMTLYIRSVERAAERNTIEACARIAELHQGGEIAAAIRKLPLPVNGFKSLNEDAA